MKIRQHFQTSREDRPIETSADDQLDRGPFVDSLIRALIIEERDSDGRCVGRRATGSVVGLTGRWGLGKSSVLNLLFKKLKKTDYVIVALFNPWLFKGRDELVSGFFNALRGAMGRSPTETARSLQESLDRYWSAIDLAGVGVAATLDIYGGAGTATIVWNRFSECIRKLLNKPRILTPDEERASLEKKIGQTRQAIVILIDELDRVEDEDVRAVAQLVKAVGDIRGVSYLVAYDPDRVVDALGRGDDTIRRKTGELYLEKIIQHAIPLRPLFSEDTKALLKSALHDHEIQLSPEKDNQNTILDHLIDEIKTPREIKRLIGAFSVLERTVRGEICGYDVLLYCWILTKTPLLRDRIESHIEDLVDDPNTTELMKRASARFDGNNKRNFMDLLGPAAEDQLRTLELLFPNFISEGPTGDGDRLSRRRNLVRMLYLGNPPSMPRRIDIEKLWNNTNLEDLRDRLRVISRDGKLTSIMDRLDDLLPLLPEGGDRTFWVGLSRAFYRESDWLIKPENTRNISDEASMILYRFGRRDHHQRRRVKITIKALIEADDLILVPAILRRNLFAHGLTIHRQAPRHDEILNLDETQSLLELELPRYRNAVFSGNALRRLPNAELIYVILNSGRWDASLREALTKQLSSLDAIQTFAALFTPPGAAVDPPTIANLVDVPALRRTFILESTRQAIEINPWNKDCLERLRQAISEERQNSTSEIPM